MTASENQLSTKGLANRLIDRTSLSDSSGDFDLDGSMRSIAENPLTVPPKAFRDFEGSLKELLDRAGSPGFLPPGVPSQIGRYRLLRFLGSGGFGIVFEAEDTTLNRRVAIKLPKTELSLSAETVRCFLDEARSVANLDHPGILTPLDADIVNSQPYIVYPFCPGKCLSKWLVNNPVSIAPKLVAQIVLKLAEAVAFSHQAGVLHRDIKPANVLLFPDPRGVPEFPFQIKLTDFGLAKVASLDATQTSSSGLAGTPLYLPPERLSNNSEAVAASDIYAIGVVCYELLTRRRPFENSNLFELMRSIRDSVPQSPKEIRGDSPASLSAICMKCLEKRPQDRYQTADELADDLVRFLNGNPVAAKSASHSRIALNWIRNPDRQKELGVLSITLGVILIVWSVVAAVSIQYRGEADLTFNEALINTVALSLTVAGPLALAGVVTFQGRRWGILLGAVISMVGLFVSILAFTEYAIAFPELYQENPMARTAVFSMLGIAFIGIFAANAILFWSTKAQIAVAQHWQTSIDDASNKIGSEREADDRVA